MKINKNINLVATMLLLLASASYAVWESEVEFAETIQLEDGTELVLNGTGLRRKWFFKIYSAGLYLPEKSSDTNTIISMPGPKLMRMVFLYSEVSREKLLATLDKGFEDNHSEEELVILSGQLSELKALFKTVKKGDEVVLNYSDLFGTQVYFNNELQGAIEGFEFSQAIFRVWLGAVPADKKLKEGLLGLSE